MWHCFLLSRQSRDFWGPRWASQSQIAKIPKGPKIEKIQDRPPGLKISISTPSKPLFLWVILKVRIEIFNRDWNFQSRMEIFNRDWFFSIFGPSLRIFWGYFLPWKLFLFSEVIFKDPPKIAFKTSIKNNLARLFLFFEVIFCLARLFLKNSLKRFLGLRDRCDFGALRCNHFDDKGKAGEFTLKDRDAPRCPPCEAAGSPWSMLSTVPASCSSSQLFAPCWQHL